MNNKCILRASKMIGKLKEKIQINGLRSSAFLQNLRNLNRIFQKRIVLRTYKKTLTENIL